MKTDYKGCQGGGGGGGGGGVRLSRTEAGHAHRRVVKKFRTTQSQVLFIAKNLKPILNS
ncbi:MAG: hypothetical protein IPP06_00795 [Saprospiraceae bacterium]|nr:hypothetical protein [Candidatus Vicinibacter affinis]